MFLVGFGRDKDPSCFTALDSLAVRSRKQLPRAAAFCKVKGCEAWSGSVVWILHTAASLKLRSLEFMAFPQSSFAMFEQRKTKPYGSSTPSLLSSFSLLQTTLIPLVIACAICESCFVARRRQPRLHRQSQCYRLDSSGSATAFIPGLRNSLKVLL